MCWHLVEYVMIGYRWQVLWIAPRLINRRDRHFEPKTPVIPLNTLIDRFDGTDSLQR